MTIAEEAKLRRSLLPEKVVLDGVDPVGVGILVFVDQYDWVLFRQDASELSGLHESDGEDENIVMMNGHTTVVDAAVPKLVLDCALAEVADFGDSVGPVLKVWQPLPQLPLETADERPAECVDRAAIDERTSVGPGVDLVFRHVGEGDARNLLMPLRQSVLVAVHKETKRLDERVCLSRAGTGFDEETLFALQAAIHLGKGFAAGFFGRVQLFCGLNHLDPPLLRGRRQWSSGRPLRPRQECHQPQAISIRRGCSRERSSRFRR